MAAPARQNPEDFLELVERSRRGKLKLYVGFAAGVGKTWRMLEEARALRRRGVDVVGALVETHGRAETAAQVGDLELVPRRQVEYRGVVVEEMDLDAVLARRPTVAIVDEIPHTNAPGSRNGKRWQDVVELLAAGMNVIGALNVQHLESLNDLIQRNTGVQVRETVPDAFLEQADQVVNLDLAVEDLLDRLKAGKIYPEERIPWALEHFFRDANLSTLRELSLREVAQSLDRAAIRQPSATPSAPAARAGHGLPLLESPPRGDPAPSRVAHGGAAQHRLVRRVRRDPPGGAGADRLGGPAPPARQHHQGEGAGGRGGAPAVGRPRRGAPRLRPHPPGERPRARPRRPRPGGAASCAARCSTGCWTGPRGSTSTWSRSTRRGLPDDAAAQAPARPGSAGGGAAPRRRGLAANGGLPGGELGDHPQGQLPQRARRPAHGRRHRRAGPRGPAPRAGP